MQSAKCGREAYRWVERTMHEGTRPDATRRTKDNEARNPIKHGSSLL